VADYAGLLRDHTTSTCRSVDRFFLQGYVPKLQSVGQVCRFLRWAVNAPRKKPIQQLRRPRDAKEPPLDAGPSHG
jgi:hypothetical protein